MKPKLLTANWGAIIPGAFFLIAAIFSALTLYNFDEITKSYPQTTLWLAIVFLVIGILFVCITLKTIEGVAKTSDETSFKREAEAIKAAFKQIEAEKSPLLTLFFEPEEPPFKMEPDSTREIDFGLILSQGRQVTNASVIFFAPPGFDFPNTKTYKQPSYKELWSDFMLTRVSLGDVFRNINSVSSVHIKCPTEKGNYKLFYQITGGDYSGEHEDFEVIIE